MEDKPNRKILICKRGIKKRSKVMYLALRNNYVWVWNRDEATIFNEGDTIFSCSVQVKSNYKVWAEVCDLETK